MISEAFSNAQAILIERWKTMALTALVGLGATFLVGIVAFFALGTLAVGLFGEATDAGLAAAQQAQPMAPGQAGAVTPQVADPAALTAAQETAATQATTSGLLAGGMEVFVAILVFMALIGWMTAVTSLGVLRAAAGSDDVVGNLRASMSGALKVAAIYLGLFVGATVLISLAAPLVVLVLLLAIPTYFAFAMALPSIALQRSTWGLADGLRVVRAAPATVIGPLVIVGICSTVLNIIPFLGQIMMLGAYVPLHALLLSVYLTADGSGLDPAGSGDQLHDETMSAAAGPAETGYGTPAAYEAPAHLASAPMPGAAAAAPAAPAPPTQSEVVSEQREGQLAAGQPGGDWVQVTGSGVLQVQVLWSEGEPLTLNISNQAGEWLNPRQVATHPLGVMLQVEPGWYYVYLADPAGQPRSWRMAISAPRGAAVA